MISCVVRNQTMMQNEIFQEQWGAVHELPKISQKELQPNVSLHWHSVTHTSKVSIKDRKA